MVTGNGENRVSSSSFSSSSSLFLSFLNPPTAFTRAAPRPKQPRTVVKFFWQVPFEPSF